MVSLAACLVLLALFSGGSYGYRRVYDFDIGRIYGKISRSNDVPGQWLAEDATYGVVTQGNTPEHAERMLLEAVRMFVVDNTRMSGTKIPYDKDKNILHEAMRAFREARLRMDAKSDKQIFETEDLAVVYVRFDLDLGLPLEEILVEHTFVNRVA